jgi:uncharacterized protein YeeX (DUF496 family)
MEDLVDKGVSVFSQTDTMADGYLEKRMQDYEVRKAEYLRRKRHLPKHTKRLERPDDEAL